jgi:hypothetical protein
MNSKRNVTIYRAIQSKILLKLLNVFRAYNIYLGGKAMANYPQELAQVAAY